jgi:hypothetical protein
LARMLANKGNGRQAKTAVRRAFLQCVSACYKPEQTPGNASEGRGQGFESLRARH